MRIIEQEGRTTEEAIEAALAALGEQRENVKVEILDEGNKGLFGLVGAKPARVKAMVEVMGIDAARHTVTKILSLSGFQAEIHAEPEDEETQVISIEGPKVSGLIGKHGQTLNSLQYLVNLITRRLDPDSPKVVLDIEGYRERRRESLREMAMRLADRVRTSGAEENLEPMAAGERRVIHMALAQDPDVTTYSRGEGPMRRVVIGMKDGASPRKPPEPAEAELDEIDDNIGNRW